MNIALITVFMLGYMAIASEHFIKVNKAATALLTGVLCWSLLVLGSHDFHEVYRQIMEHTADTAGILFFLMGAMTIVEIIDLYNGFDTITEKLTSAGNRRLLWLVGILSFFLSAMLDNLTTTIVMVSLLGKLGLKRENLLLYIGIVVISVNAGGAWSPIGDVTTTMLWIGSQITTVSIMVSLIVPSLFCAAVPLLWVTFKLKNEASHAGNLEIRQSPGSRHSQRIFVFVLGVSCLLFVPVFKGITHLPPFIGMLFGLGVLWVATEFIRRKKQKSGEESHSVLTALQRIDMSTILFFLGILLSVTALESAGLLSRLGAVLEQSIGNISAIVFSIGLLSAVVDNVPLVAAAMKMYPLSYFQPDHYFWTFLSYCAGTGGSILIIGYAAGVAAMGMAKIDFFWYLKKIAPLAFIGYCAGAAVFFLQSRIF
jgi:Na+/H+ antiporter NhaD/arsenite permease-like protein